MKVACQLQLHTIFSRLYLMANSVYSVSRPVPYVQCLMSYVSCPVPYDVICFVGFCMEAGFTLKDLLL